MSKYRVAINGFGRIGRMSLRALLEKPEIEIIAVNDLTDAKTLAHLLKYDSIQGKFKGTITLEGDVISVNEKAIQCVHEVDPSKLPWAKLAVDLVLESTGRFTSYASASAHIKAGAKKVIISAPTDKDIKTIVMGVNDHQITASDTILSNASCTTNCIAPILKVLDDEWGIEHAYLSTVHAYTSDQRLHDSPHKDLRRARAAALSIIPTTTGAAKAVYQVLPQLKGKLSGKAIRVPVPDGSLTDIVCRLKKPVGKEEINQRFLSASKTNFKGIIEYSDEPLVSVDIIGNPHSAIFDSLLTDTEDINCNLVAWYDNEGGYSHRLADIIERISKF